MSTGSALAVGVHDEEHDDADDNEPHNVTESVFGCLRLGVRPRGRPVRP